MSPSSAESYSLSSSKESQLQAPMRVNITKSQSKTTFPNRNFDSRNISNNGTTSKTLLQTSKPSKLNNALQMLAKLDEKYKTKPVASKPSVRSSSSSTTSAEQAPGIKDKTTIYQNNSSTLITPNTNKTVTTARLLSPPQEIVMSKVAIQSQDLENDYESDFESQSDESIEETEIQAQVINEEVSSILTSIQSETNTSIVASVQLKSNNGLLKTANNSKEYIQDFTFQQKIFDIEDLLLVDEVDVLNKNAQTFDSNLVTPKDRVADWVASYVESVQHSSSDDEEVEIEEILDDEFEGEFPVQETNSSLNNKINIEYKMVKENDSHVSTHNTRSEIDVEKDQKIVNKSRTIKSNVELVLETGSTIKTHDSEDDYSLIKSEPKVTKEFEEAKVIENKQQRSKNRTKDGSSSTEGTKCQMVKDGDVANERRKSRTRVCSSSTERTSSSMTSEESGKKNEHEAKERRKTNKSQPRFEALKMSWEFEDSTQPSQFARYDTSQSFQLLSPELHKQVLELQQPIQSAINELLKHQIRLTRHFMASQYRMYQNYSAAVQSIANDYHPTTLQDTKQFIAEQRKARMRLPTRL